MSKIQTLDEILAQMGQPVCAKTSAPKATNTPNTTPLDSPAAPSQEFKQPSPKNPKSRPDHHSKDTKRKHNKQKQHAVIDTAPTLKEDIPMDSAMSAVLQDVAIEPLVMPDKQENRLRWLAFHYLSRRELSQKELRQKLLDKDQDGEKVEALLIEFAEKGYQSDERCAYMLIREAIRKGRGKRHILDSFREHGISLPNSLDELIAKADIDSLKDGTVLDDDVEDTEIDWLKLAVEARSKKYGDTPPKDPKDKARQLRFLQYRGFEMDVCFDALKFSLKDLDER